jgi:hypothetical protein
MKTKDEMEIVGRVQVADVIRAVEHAFANHFGFETDPIEKYIHTIMADRHKGGRTDPKARINRDEYHQFLSQLSKPELIDLVLQILGNDFCRFNEKKQHRKVEFFDELAREVCAMFNSRYLLRHPEEW